MDEIEWRHALEVRQLEENQLERLDMLLTKMSEIATALENTNRLLLQIRERMK